MVQTVGRNPEVVQVTCPNCKSNQTDVVDSRPFPDHVNRRRRCLGCGHRFSTIEIEKVQHESLINRANVIQRLRRIMDLL